MPQLCSVDVSRPNGCVVVHLRGEVDASNSIEIEELLVHARQQNKPFVVDLSELAYIDSSGLGALQRLARDAPLRIVLPPAAIVSRVVAVTGLAQLVPVFPSLDDALVEPER